MPYKDPNERREYARTWIANRRKEFFGDKSCVKCGATEDLELDHIDPANKVSHRIWSWSAARREVEIAKCQVLCHSCHLSKSIGQMSETLGWTAYRHGTHNMYKKHGCKCGLCMLWKRNDTRQYRARHAGVV